MGFIKDIIRSHADKKDDFISEWYWRRKYNTLRVQMDELLEVMRSDIYNKVINDITTPLDVKRLQKTIKRLNNKCAFLLEERNRLYDENKILKKKGREIKNNHEETKIIG